MRKAIDADSVLLASITVDLHSAALKFTVVPAPCFQRHRNHPRLKAFAAGATAAATGAMAGAVVVLGIRTFHGLPSVTIGSLHL